MEDSKLSAPSGWRGEGSPAPCGLPRGLFRTQAPEVHIWGPQCEVQSHLHSLWRLHWAHNSRIAEELSRRIVLAYPVAAGAVDVGSVFEEA
jgi:hypothetical protein